MRARRRLLLKFLPISYRSCYYGWANEYFGPCRAVDKKHWIAWMLENCDQDYAICIADLRKATQSKDRSTRKELEEQFREMIEEFSLSSG